MAQKINGTQMHTPVTGDIDIASMGSKSVAGLPFKPSMIEFFGGVTSSDVTVGYMRATYVDGAVTCYTTAGRGNLAGSRLYTDRVSIVLQPASGALITGARIDSIVLTDDGFSYACTSSSADLFMRYIAYP